MKVGDCALPLQCEAAGLPRPQVEYRFCARRWRFDFAWPREKLALEVQGGGWTNGRHSRALGQAKDYEKLAEAVLLGWRVFYATPQQVSDGAVLSWITRGLAVE